MGKIIALIAAVIGLIFMVMVALVGFNVVEPEPMIAFAGAIADMFHSLANAAPIPTDEG